MEKTNFNLNEGDITPDYGTSKYPTPDSPGACPAVQPGESPGGKTRLPLLRLNDWQEDAQYDRNNPKYIHYDFEWKVSQRENIRSRQVDKDSEPDISLAPSDYWEVKFRKQLDSLLQDKRKFPSESYMCEETSIAISIERTRGRGLTKRFKGQTIDWNIVDSHLEGLGALFRVGKTMDKRITLFIELVYKEDTKAPAPTKKQKKKKSQSDAQRAQMEAEAGLWSRVYEHWRCIAKHCKQGPQCWPDENGIHYRLENKHLEKLVNYIKSKMKAGDKVEDVDIDIDIPSHILKDVLDVSRKRKAEDPCDSRPCKTQCGHGCGGKITSDGNSVVIPGDIAQRLEQYCNWTVARTNSDRWRSPLEKGTQFAMDHFLELNSVLQHPKAASDLMIKGGVKPGIALQFVSKQNIEKWWKEQGEIEHT